MANAYVECVCLISHDYSCLASRDGEKLFTITLPNATAEQNIIFYQSQLNMPTGRNLATLHVPVHRLVVLYKHSAEKCSSDYC